MTSFSLIRVFVTFFYSGLSPRAPGTAGTLATAIPLGIVSYLYPDMFRQSLSGVIFISWFIPFYLLATYATHRYMVFTGRHDPKEVVIDETAGLIVTYATLFFILSFWDIDFDGHTSLIGAVLCFVFFRFFDIVKPYPISYIDKHCNNAQGVMLDDIVAGICAGICVFPLIYFLP